MRNILLMLIATFLPVAGMFASESDNWRVKHPEWIWCDDFETDRLGSYFEFDSAGGTLTRAAGVGLNGSTGMKAVFSTGTVNAGNLRLAFGRTPSGYIRPVDAGMKDYRELYWRVYLRRQPGWSGGGGDKLSRATILATANWAQAAFGHVWSGGAANNNNYLVLDPASGTDASGILQTTVYNDFPNMRWLGSAQSTTPIFDVAHAGQWQCIEAHMKLNDAGSANGLFELWINGHLEARKTNLNWVGAFNAYGLNALFLENYWNAGSPQTQERYFDNLVVSTQPIGPLGGTNRPVITNFTARGDSTVFQFNTAFGAGYDVQFTTNLTGGVWSVVASNLAGSGELVTVTNADPTHRPCQFYRVRQLP